MNIVRYLLVLSTLIITLSGGTVAAQTLTCGGSIVDAADSTLADGATWYAYKLDGTSVLQGGTVGEVTSGYWAGEVGYFLQSLTVNDEVLVLIEKDRNAGSIDHAGYYGVIASQLGGTDPVAYPAMTLRSVPVPEATIENSAVSLSWQEAGEDGSGNVVGYDLLRSGDGVNFERVNADTIETLTYTDSAFAKDTNYYALRLVYRGNPPVESNVYSANSNSLQGIDSDGDGLSDILELSGCTSATDTDSDDDGIPDNVEDANHNGIVDVGEDLNHNGILDPGEDINGDGFLNPAETDPCLADTDGDFIQDGTESGLTSDDIGLDTDTSVFIADADPSTTTNPTLADSDQDGITDGAEDTNRNGRLDSGELDPNLNQTCNFDVTPSSLTTSFMADGGSSTINVSTIEGCIWNATESVDWIEITAGSSGNGNGAAAYSVSQNLTNNPRSTDISVAGHLFNINQFGIIQAGDVDGSGTVDLSDTIIVLQVMAGSLVTDPVLSAADSDGDDRIGLSEAISTLRDIAGL